MGAYGPPLGVTGAAGTRGLFLPPASGGRAEIGEAEGETAEGESAEGETVGAPPWAGAWRGEDQETSEKNRLS